MTLMGLLLKVNKALKSGPTDLALKKKSTPKPIIPVSQFLAFFDFPQYYFDRKVKYFCAARQQLSTVLEYSDALPHL